MFGTSEMKSLHFQRRNLGIPLNSLIQQIVNLFQSTFFILHFLEQCEQKTVRNLSMEGVLKKETMNNSNLTYNAIHT